MTTRVEHSSTEEQAAVRERARELEAHARGADGEAAALAKIAQMPADEQVLAAGFHELVKDVAPELTVRTWYGMCSSLDLHEPATRQLHPDGRVAPLDVASPVPARRTLPWVRAGYLGRPASRRAVAQVSVVSRRIGC